MYAITVIAFQRQDKSQGLTDAPQGRHMWLGRFALRMSGPGSLVNSDPCRGAGHNCRVLCSSSAHVHHSFLPSPSLAAVLIPCGKHE